MAEKFIVKKLHRRERPINEPTKIEEVLELCRHALYTPAPLFFILDHCPSNEELAKLAMDMANEHPTLNIEIRAACIGVLVIGEPRGEAAPPPTKQAILLRDGDITIALPVQ